MIATEEITKTERYRKDQDFRSEGDSFLFGAFDTVSNTSVLLRERPIRMSKIMSLGQQEAVRTAFAEKAKILMAVKHESVQRVLDYFSDIDRHCLVMESVGGNDLCELLEKNKWAFPLHDVINWADQLLDALHYLHTYLPPIVHRDIRPRNLKLTPGGKIKLLGLGFSPDADEKADTAGANLSYVPLEQIWSGLDTASQKVIINSYDDRAERLLRHPPDARSDIYAVGATLYHLLTGSPPVDALERSIDTLDGKPDPLRSPGELDAGVPVEISEVLMKALEIRRENRYDSAVIMRQVLRTALVRVKEREAVEAVEQEKLNAEWEASLAREETVQPERTARQEAQPIVVAEPVWLDHEAEEAEVRAFEQPVLAVEIEQIEITEVLDVEPEPDEPIIGAFEVAPEQIEEQMRLDLEAEHEKQEIEEQMRSDLEVEQARQIEEQMWLDLEAERARVEEKNRVAEQKRLETEAERHFVGQEHSEHEAEADRQTGTERHAREAETERLLEVQRAADARKVLLVKELETLADSDPLQPIAAPVDDPDDDILEIPPAPPVSPAPARRIHTTEEPLFVQTQKSGGGPRWLIPAAAIVLVLAGGAFFGMRSFLATKTVDSNQPPAAAQITITSDTATEPPVQNGAAPVTEKSPENIVTPEVSPKDASLETPAGSTPVKNKPAAQPQPEAKKPAAAPAKTPEPKKKVTVDDLIKDN